MKKEELPNFFVVHPLSDRVVPLPDALTAPEDFSSEIIMLWALRTAHGLDIELYDYNIELHDEKVAKGETEIEAWETEQYAEAKENVELAKKKKEEVD